MVKPNQPKGIKPKAEIEEAGEAGVSAPAGKMMDLTPEKLIIVNTVITVIICTLFIGGNYLIVNSVVGSKLEGLSEITAALPGEHGGSSEPHGSGKQEKGIILDLGEFILNLSDPSAKRYLKVNVALELTKSPNDPDLSAHGDSGGQGGGHGGGGVDPLEMIEKEMKQYKPAIRDAIISVLSSKTTEELSSLAGKELAKEQIREAVEPIFHGEREVLRISFGTFIIQ